MNKIAVVGSLNYDYTVQLDHLPTTGETILSSGLSFAFGGKGANQAVAIAKMKGDVAMIGAVGDDVIGQRMLDNLKRHGVDISGIVIKSQEASGFAHIYIDKEGKNMIVVHPGANFSLTIDDIKKKEELLLQAKYCLLQLEIPMDVISYVVNFCHEHKIQVILNPAPAAPLSMELLSKISYLVPNESELALLTGCETVDPITQARALVDQGVEKVLVTLGEQGSVLVSKENQMLVEAKRVQAVDTTAAGDSYLGGFLAALASGKTEQEAMMFGTKVAAITVQRPGAQDAIPTWEEVLEL